MTLFLLPNLLSDECLCEGVFPSELPEIVRSLNGLIAESERGGRHYLLRFISRDQLASIPIKLLNEHSSLAERDELLKPLRKGERWGVISDAGIPCLADPGGSLVFAAQKNNISVVAIPGPSAPILALQLSGLNGQRFAFHGYLPRDRSDLQQVLKKLEKRSREEGETQIWIETPYRSRKMAEISFEILHSHTLFTIARNLTAPNQCVETKMIAQWKESSCSLEKDPAVFLMLDIDS